MERPWLTYHPTFHLDVARHLSGLTGATVVVTNTAARAFDWAPKWLGLVVALACTAWPL